MIEAKQPNAIFSFDVDGIICKLPTWERRVTGAMPYFVEGIQRVFQYPKGPFLDSRQQRSLAYLRKRVIDEEAIKAIKLLHEEGGSTGKEIEIAIATERPVAAHDILLGQLRECGVAELISRWWENPFGGNLTRVKENMAQELRGEGIFHAHLEDKRKPSEIVARFGSLSYLMTGVATRFWGVPRNDQIVQVNNCVEAVELFLEEVYAMPV